MENEIKESLYNKINISTFLNKENSNINNEYSMEKNNDSNKEQKETKKSNIEIAKEILQKMLKKSLDQRLNICEKKSKSHFLAINSTLEITKSITNLTIRINRQINEKMKKDKEKQSKRNNKYGRYKKGLSPNKSIISNTHNNFYRSKTPSHMGKQGNIHNKTSILGPRREIIKSKSTIVKNPRAAIQNEKNSRKINKKRTIGVKNKSSISFNKYLNNESNLDELQTISVTSIKTNKSNTTNLNTINNSRINNTYIYKTNNKSKNQNSEINLKHNTRRSKDKLTKIKNINNFILSEKNLLSIKGKKIVLSTNNINFNNINIDDKKNKRKKTPFNKKNSNISNDNKSFKNSASRDKKKEKTVEDEIDAILSIENSLQKDNLLNNDDPLLILPLKDLDFVPESLLRRNSVRNEKRNKQKNYIISSFDIYQNLEKIRFKYIFRYLILEDLLSIKNISKEFHQLILIYLISYLEKEKLNILKIKDSLNISEIPIREEIENIVLSKGSKKATQLLNESLLNHLFKDDKIPEDDIILIYRIYFQMINHPFALIAKTDTEKFWEKCKFYFTNEENGKTGDILINMINKKKIVINGNNLYQIYNLVKGNLNKIIPNYFSSLCGTTGLFVFIIKDILEFLGISQKIKHKENAYWTYTEIIEALNQKINYLKLSNI